VTIIVEPKVFQELVDAGRVIPLAPSQQQQQQVSKVTISSKADADNSSSIVSASGGRSSLAHTGSSSSLSGMLISTAQAAPQLGLFPVNSWAGPSSGSSGSGSAAAAAGGGGVVGAGGAAAGVIKTWQPELQVDQRQDGQQNDNGSNGSSGSSMVQENDLIPEAVAQQLDLVVVLGGDGTVLWTCHIFGNRCGCSCRVVLGRAEQRERAANVHVPAASWLGRSSYDSLASLSPVRYVAWVWHSSVTPLFQ
jgi:hypothetical protein